MYNRKSNPALAFNTITAYSISKQCQEVTLAINKWRHSGYILKRDTSYISDVKCSVSIVETKCRDTQIFKFTVDPN